MIHESKIIPKVGWAVVNTETGATVERYGKDETAANVKRDTLNAQLQRETYAWFVREFSLDYADYAVELFFDRAAADKLREWFLLTYRALV